MQRRPGPDRTANAIRPFAALVYGPCPAAKAQHANALAPRKAALDRNPDHLLLADPQCPQPPLPARPKSSGIGCTCSHRLDTNAHANAGSLPAKRGAIRGSRRLGAANDEPPCSLKCWLAAPTRWGLRQLAALTADPVAGRRRYNWVPAAGRNHSYAAGTNRMRRSAVRRSPETCKHRVK